MVLLEVARTEVPASSDSRVVCGNRGNQGSSAQPTTRVVVRVEAARAVEVGVVVYTRSRPTTGPA